MAHQLEAATLSSAVSDDPATDGFFVHDAT